MLRFATNAGRRLIHVSQWRTLQCSALRGFPVAQEQLQEDRDADSETASDATESPKKTQGLTPDAPFMVASHMSKCIVGCSCAGNTAIVNWFYITEGEAQTCDCGYFFKLAVVDPKTEFVPEYSRVMYVDESVEDPRRKQPEGWLLGRLFRRYRRAIAPSSMAKKMEERRSDS